MTKARNAFGKLDCPQSDCEKVGERGFDGPQGLGSHLKSVHGIAGIAASTLSARRAKGQGTPEPNTWGRYDCPDRRCDRKGEKGLPHPQGLGRHLQAIHGQAGQGPEAERHRQRKGEAALARREEAPTRRYTRRVASDDSGNDRAVAEVHVAVEPVTPHADPLHYCPGCGFDLDAAKHHLHPSIRDHAYIRCPQCRTNLAVVSAVLRPEIQTIPPEHALALVEAARRVSSVL